LQNVMMTNTIACETVVGRKRGGLHVTSKTKIQAQTAARSALYCQGWTQGQVKLEKKGTLDRRKRQVSAYDESLRKSRMPENRSGNRLRTKKGQWPPICIKIKTRGTAATNLAGVKRRAQSEMIGDKNDFPEMGM